MKKHERPLSILIFLVMAASLLSMTACSLFTIKKPEPFIPRVAILDSIDPRLLEKCEDFKTTAVINSVNDIIVVKGEETTAQNSCRLRANALMDELKKARAKMAEADAKEKAEKDGKK